MVITPRRNGDVIICVDLTNLNKVVKREVHPMASVDENLAKVKNSKLFSKLDANSGSFFSVADKLGREFMIHLQSAPMTVHSVAATISFPSSLSSLDLRSVAMT